MLDNEGINAPPKSTNDDSATVNNTDTVRFGDTNKSSSANETA